MEKDDGMEETVAAFQYYVEGVGILAVGSVGVVINIVALYILFRKQVSFISKNSVCCSAKKKGDQINQKEEEEKEKQVWSQ